MTGRDDSMELVGGDVVELVERLVRSDCSLVMSGG
jgi:hypothetical protein